LFLPLSSLPTNVEFEALGASSSATAWICIALSLISPRTRPFGSFLPLVEQLPRLLRSFLSGFHFFLGFSSSDRHTFRSSRRPLASVYCLFGINDCRFPSTFFFSFTVFTVSYFVSVVSIVVCLLLTFGLVTSYLSLGYLFNLLARLLFIAFCFQFWVHARNHDLGALRAYIIALSIPRLM
jgi:hypothetical protein